MRAKWRSAQGQKNFSGPLAELTEFLLAHSHGVRDGVRVFPVNVEADKRVSFVGRERF
jgi:hypothetical protein